VRLKRLQKFENNRLNELRIKIAKILETDPKWDPKRYRRRFYLKIPCGYHVRWKWQFPLISRGGVWTVRWVTVRYKYRLIYKSDDRDSSVIIDMNHLPNFKIILDELSIYMKEGISSTRDRNLYNDEYIKALLDL
jgi:hypothetical protein